MKTDPVKQVYSKPVLTNLSTAQTEATKNMKGKTEGINSMMMAQYGGLHPS